MREGQDAFMEHCSSFLEEQVREMRPRAVAVMGVPAWRFLGGMAAELRSWMKRPVSPAAIRTTLGGHPTVAVQLLHMSGQGRFMRSRDIGQRARRSVETWSCCAAQSRTQAGKT